MIRCKNALTGAQEVYVQGKFSLEKWKTYIEKVFPGCASLFLSDVDSCLATGKYTWEGDFLPVLEAVPGHPGLQEMERHFSAVTKGLEERVLSLFGRSMDVEIVLYLGLLNGAGWVTEVNGRQHVLLGAEKILELGWQGMDAMRGLVWHELGHVYQARWGTLERETENKEEAFVWQLFTEGVAMVFEQLLSGDDDYFHQDRDGWKAWCDAHFEQSLADFAADLPHMTFQNQRFFGDWASYEGKGDVGYYLGAKFVRHLMQKTPFDRLITWDTQQVYEQFCRYKEEICSAGKKLERLIPD